MPTNSNADETRKLVDLVSADGTFADAGFPLGQVKDDRRGDNLDFWAHDAAYAAAHAGNLGDATDPFDGGSFSEYEFTFSPSAAASAVAVRLIRPGPEGLLADIEPPRWGGVIREEVHWAGNVLVDGDITVAPEGRLIIHPNARIRFAATDRLATGLDPERIELRIQGELSIDETSASFRYVRGKIGRVVPQPVQFEPLTPGASWNGIFFDPQNNNGRVRAPEGSYEIRGVRVPEGRYQVGGAERGIVILNAPPGVKGLVIDEYQILDFNGKNTAGNGDGRPGWVKPSS